MSKEKLQVKPIKAGNLTFQYYTQLQKELKRLKKFQGATEGLDEKAAKFVRDRSNANWLKQERIAGTKGKLSVINYGTWAGPKNWRSKAGSLQGRIELIEGEITRSKNFMSQRYNKFGTHYPVPRGTKPPTTDKKSGARVGLYLGPKEVVNPFHHTGFDDDLQNQGKKLKIKVDSGGASDGEAKTSNEISVQSDISVPNLRVKDGTLLAMNTAKKQRRDKAPAELTWVTDEKLGNQLPKGHEVKGSSANNKARLILNRAKDINRAYGGMSNKAKSDYLKNPITQLELEA